MSAVQSLFAALDRDVNWYCEASHRTVLATRWHMTSRPDDGRFHTVSHFAVQSLEAARAAAKALKQAAA